MRFGQVSASTPYQPASVWSGTRVPAATDDATKGFEVGSWWYATTTANTLYLCVDATAGKAVWKSIGLK